MVLSRDGVVVADSSGQPDEQATALAQQGERTLPGGFRALRGDRPVAVGFPVDGVQYVGAFQVVGSKGGPEWIAAVLMREDEVLQVVYSTRRDALTLGMLLLSVAVVLGSVVAHRVAGPLNVVARDLEQVGGSSCRRMPSPSSFVREIAVVGDSVDRMKAGLRSFARYVPMELVDDLLARGEDAHLGVQPRRMTIHFSDVEGFEPDRGASAAGGADRAVERVPAGDDGDFARGARLDRQVPGGRDSGVLQCAARCAGPCAAGVHGGGPLHGAAGGAEPGLGGGWEVGVPRADRAARGRDAGW